MREEGEVGGVSGGRGGGCREGRGGCTARAPRALGASGEEARDCLPRQKRVRLGNLLAKTSVIKGKERIYSFVMFCVASDKITGGFVGCLV